MAMGRGYYGRPGPKPGSTFAGGSFSPRRRMTAPTSTNTSPTPPTSGGLPGKRVGWDGKALPPGQMKRMAAGKSLNGHWGPIAQAAGLVPPAAGSASAPATHGMPDGSMMPGAAHMPSFPSQAQVPMPGFMPQGLMRPGMGRRVIGQPMPRNEMEQFPIVY